VPETPSIEQNNIYWFLRDLGAASFGSFAVKEPDSVLSLGEELQTHIENSDSIETIQNTIKERILGAVNEFHNGRRTQRYARTENLVKQINVRIENIEDVRDLRIACYSVVRTTEVLDSAPEFDKDSVGKVVEATLTDESTQQYNPENAYLALEEVDDAGTRLQAGGQNMALVSYVEDLISEMDSVDSYTRARSIAAVTQEFERRAGNKRKSDAGGVLETALNSVFGKFDVPVTGSPRHFGDFEIDNLLKTEQAVIGFSCKRTLRERFRQSLTREADIDIDEVWFVPLSTDDISREKVEDIQHDGGRVYVSRESNEWQEFGGRGGLKALRPGDQFLTDLEKMAGISLNTDLK